MSEVTHDAAVLGGGLAGLCLALQLRHADPTLRVVVADARARPAPEAAFKVGESTVELSAHYFAEVLGLRDHIERHQLPKFGLRFWFPAGDNGDLTRRLEVGPAVESATPSYQLDRGRFENELWRRCGDAGVELLDDCRVEGVELGAGGAPHVISLNRAGEPAAITARWALDTSGRFGLLKRQLGIGNDVEHQVNASWFRLAGGLDLEEWGAHDEEWLERIPERGLRRLSTNHLMGEGYWVWLIPLASGPISIGVVADPRFHPYAEIDDLEGVFDWIERHEPQLAAAIRDRRDDVQDFLSFEHFAFGCERAFSPDRWALVGEAGVFVDPFYSPGSDLIAQGNTYVTDLVTRDVAGEDVSERAELWNQLYLGLFQGYLKLYTNMYEIWGNPRVMPAKLLWDYAKYWLFGCPRFFQGLLTEVPPVGLDRYQRMAEIDNRLQPMLRDWHRRSGAPDRRGFVDFSSLPWITARQNTLRQPLDPEGLIALFDANIRVIEALAVQIFASALEDLGDVSLPEDARIKPSAISLDPKRWEEDGLLAEGGMTVREAHELAPGLSHVWAATNAVPV